MEKEAKVDAPREPAGAYAPVERGFVDRRFGPWNESVLWDLMLKQMPTFGLRSKHGRDCLLILLCTAGFAVGMQWESDRFGLFFLAFIAVVGTVSVAYMITPYRLKRHIFRTQFGHELLASPLRNEDLAAAINGAFSISAVMALLPFVVCMASTGRPQNVLGVICVGLYFATFLTIGYWLVIGGHPLVVWLGTPVAACTGLVVVWTPMLLTKQMHICQASVVDIWRKELFP